MDNLKTELPRKIKTLLPYWVIVSVALIIAGICCLCIQSTTTSTKKACISSSKYEYEKILEYNYADCEDTNEDGKPCNSRDVETKPCLCIELLVIPKDIIGDVVIFYRLDTFNESEIAMKDNFFQSRDHNQLRGLMSDTPAAACKPYDYDENNRTILPCGAIADAMFTDKIDLHINRTQVPMLSYGILRDKDKEGFHNPENLTAFKNFSKPKSWKKNIWELDPRNEQNNGLQNEAFIAWMHTEWQEKPMLRLNRSSDVAGGRYQQGMPAGNYTITITYNYPYSRYKGNRTIIVKREYNVTEVSCNETLVTHQKAVSHGVGVAALIFGIIFLLLGVAAALSFFVTGRRKQTKSQPSSDPPKIQVTPSNDISENERPPTSEAERLKEEEIFLNDLKNEFKNKHESQEQVPLND